MKTFEDEFNEIIDFIEKKGLSTAFDNIIGLVNIDKMVNVMVQTPELQSELHGFILELVKGMLDFEYPDKVDESMVGYV